ETCDVCSTFSALEHHPGNACPAQSKSMKFLARVIPTSLIAILAVVNLRTQFFYADRTVRANHASAVMLERLAGLCRLPSSVTIMRDIPEVGIDNLVALYTRGHPAPKYSGDLLGLGVGLAKSPLPAGASPLYRDVQQLSVELLGLFRPLSFALTSESTEQHEFR